MQLSLHKTGAVAFGVALPCRKGVALPEDLRRAEIQRSGRQKTFLQNPSAGVERGRFNLRFPCVVLRRLPMLVAVLTQADSDAAWPDKGWVAGAEAPAGAAGGGGGGDVERGAVVNVAHCYGLAGPVEGAVLDDAEGVDPDVSKAEPVGGADRVEEGKGEGAEGNVLGHAGEV